MSIKRDELPTQLECFNGILWYTLYLQLGQPSDRKLQHKAIYCVSRQEAEFLMHNGVHTVPRVHITVED